MFATNPEILGEQSEKTYEEQLRSLLRSLSLVQRQKIQERMNLPREEAVDLPTALREEVQEEPFAVETEKLQVAREALAARETMAEGMQALDQRILEEVTREEAVPKKNEQKTFTAPRKESSPSVSSAQVSEKPKENTWFPRTIDPRKWTNKQIATLTTVTLGGATIYGLFQVWRNRRNRRKNKGQTNESVQPESTSKGGILRHLAWIPGLGLVALAAYAGNKFLTKFDPYARAMEAIEKKIEKKYEEFKNSIPFIGEKKEYGLAKEAAKNAEAAFAKTRSANDDVRRIFGLKDDETNPDFESFMKEMNEKYKPIKENGVTYIRADVAIENYETQIGAALQELQRWIAGHPAEIAGISYAAYKLGILDIEKILKGAGSVAEKAGFVVKKMAAMGIDHPFLSVLGVGASFLAIKAAVAQAKKVYLPENFEELSKAVAVNVIMLGPASDAVNNVVESSKEKWSHLMTIEGDFTVWAKDSLTDLTSKIIRKAPETVGLTREETIIQRNKSCLEDLAQVLISDQANVMTSSEGVEARLDERYAEALRRLEEFQKVFIAERGEKVIQSDEPVRALRRLDEALNVVHIELFIKDEIVRWKKEQGEEVDLCVDPALLNAEKIHDLSEKLREEHLTDGSYVALRALTDARERFETVREPAPKNWFLAVPVGQLLYFTDWENQSEFWVAPLALVRDLVSSEEWTNTIANIESAAVNTAIISTSAGLYARLTKRLLTGGTLGFNLRFKKLSWGQKLGLSHNFNPFTCPFKVLKDMVGGVIDLETFIRLGHYGERAWAGGRYINTVLDSVHVRPQWIGTIAHSMDRNELLYVARQLGKVGSVRHLDILQIKQELKHWIISELINKEARAGSIAAARVGGVIDGNEIFEAVADWSASQTKLSKFAAQGEKLLSQGLNPQEWWAETVQRAPKWKEAAQRFFRKGESIAANVPNGSELPSEKPKLKVISPENIPDVPDAAKRVIARNAANETELLQMKKGMNALAKVGVGIDGLLLVYETYQVACMWREIGKLEEQKSLSALLEEATKQKKFVFWRRAESFAGSAVGTGLGTFHVLTGKLAIVGGAVGTFAIVAIPIGLAIRAGMYEDLADLELQNKVRLRDRIEGYDELVTKTSKFEQLRELGGISLTRRLGAEMTTATVEDFEKHNQDEREEIFLSMVIRELRDMAPHSFDLLLAKLGVGGISQMRMHELSRKILLPYIGNELVRFAQAKGSLTRDVQEQLLKLNIKKGWFGSYLTEENIRAIAFDAAQILEAWTNRSDDSLPAISEARSIIDHLRKERLAEVSKRMCEAFGSAADTLLEKPAHELVALRQEHANVLVDIHYYDHSELPGIVERRKTVPFAGDRQRGVTLIRERLDILNDYLQATVHVPHLRLEPFKQFGREERHITPGESFIKAGNYHVNEVYVAADHSGGFEPARDILFLSDREMKYASRRTVWREKAVHRYRGLLQRFENGSIEAQKAA